MPGTRFFVLFALFLSYAAAQYTSGVEGTATDESGSALANARVVVTNQATQVTREITSNGAGYFLASDLAPGVYQVQVQMPGFRTWLQTDIQIDANRLRTIYPKLVIGEQKIEVQVPHRPRPLKPEKARSQPASRSAPSIRLPC